MIIVPKLNVQELQSIASGYSVTAVFFELVFESEVEAVIAMEAIDFYRDNMTKLRQLVETIDA